MSTQAGGGSQHISVVLRAISDAGGGPVNDVAAAYIDKLEAERDALRTLAELRTVDLAGVAVERDALNLQLSAERTAWAEANTQLWRAFPDLPGDEPGTKPASEWVTWLVAERAALKAALIEWHTARMAVSLHDGPKDTRIDPAFKTKLERLSAAEASQSVIARSALQPSKTEA